MLKVDAIIAADASFQPKQKITYYSEAATNEKNTGTSFKDCLNSKLQTTAAPTQAQISQVYSKTVLALYYPPVMITPKTKDKD